MGQKYKKGDNLDNPRPIYICINKDCMKKWIFVSSNSEDNGIELESRKCNSCQNQLTKECNGQSDAMVQKEEETKNKCSVTSASKSENNGKSPAFTPKSCENVKPPVVTPKNKKNAKSSIVKPTTTPTVNVINSPTATLQKKENVNQCKENGISSVISPTVQKNANEKDTATPPQKLRQLPKKDKNVIHSTKEFTVYQCTRDECGAKWKSVHGWTAGYTQRCQKNHNGIVCGNTGRYVGTRRIQEVEDVTEGKTYPYWRRVKAGRHSSDFCDMCDKIKQHGAGICTNKTDVFIRHEGSNNEAIAYLEGPPPREYPYVEIDPNIPRN